MGQVSGFLHRLSSCSHWQIDGLVIVMLLQGFIFALLPEEIIISSLGILWARGKISFIEGLLSVQLGLLPANAALVWIGGQIGPTLLERPPFCWALKRESVNRAIARFNRYGAWTVVLARFTPLVRGPVYFATGLCRIELLRFVRIDAIASVFQISLLMISAAYFTHK